MVHILGARFLQLPLRPQAVWQVACVPGQLGDSDDLVGNLHGHGTQESLCSTIWFDAIEGRPVVLPTASEGPIEVDRILDTLFNPPPDLGKDDPIGPDHRPGRIEVSDPALANTLREQLGLCETRVELCDELPGLEEMSGQVDDIVGRLMRQLAADPNAAIDSMRELLGEDAADELRKVLGDDNASHIPLPHWSDGTGVTAEQMGDFFRAARAFWTAGPWQWLSSEVDLFEIGGDVPDAAPRWVTVMGMGAEAYGLALFASSDDHRRMCRGEGLPPAGSWCVQFMHELEVPTEELQEQQEQGWPVVARYAFPMAMWNDGTDEFRRADSAMLSYFTALLRAFSGKSAKCLPHEAIQVAVKAHPGRRRLTVTPI